MGSSQPLVGVHVSGMALSRWSQGTQALAFSRPSLATIVVNPSGATKSKTYSDCIHQLTN